MQTEFQVTPAQLRAMRDIERACQKSGELFAPVPGVLAALKRRGLADYHYIGMRWYRVRLTDAGKDLLSKAGGQ